MLKRVLIRAVATRVMLAVTMDLLTIGRMRIGIVGQIKIQDIAHAVVGPRMATTVVAGMDTTTDHTALLIITGIVGIGHRTVDTHHTTAGIDLAERVASRKLS